MVEILLATYNAEAYIREQINSILEQSYTDWRLYVADDGSRDNTLELLENYHMAYPKQINYGRNDIPSGSAKNNFLRLTKAANDRNSSEYFMYCDQDDIWHINKIEVSLRRMKQLEDKYGVEVPLLVHTDLSVVDDTGNIVAESFLDYMNLPRKKDVRDVIIQNSVTGCTIMMNKALLRLVSELEEDAPILMHDHGAAILAAIYGRISLVDESTMDYRQHGDNQVGASNANSLRYKLGRYKRGKESFRDDMNASYKQIEYIIDHYGMPDNIKPVVADMLREYSKLYAKNSKDKRKFYKKYKVYKNGQIRKIVQMMWS